MGYNNRTIVCQEQESEDIMGTLTKTGKVISFSSTTVLFG